MESLWNKCRVWVFRNLWLLATVPVQSCQRPWPPTHLFFSFTARSHSWWLSVRHKLILHHIPKTLLFWFLNYLCKFLIQNTSSFSCVYLQPANYSMLFKEDIISKADKVWLWLVKMKMVIALWRQNELQNSITSFEENWTSIITYVILAGHWVELSYSVPPCEVRFTFVHLNPFYFEESFTYNVL